MYISCKLAYFLTSIMQTHSSHWWLLHHLCWSVLASLRRFIMCLYYLKHLSLCTYERNFLLWSSCKLLMIEIWNVSLRQTVTIDVLCPFMSSPVATLFSSCSSQLAWFAATVFMEPQYKHIWEAQMIFLIVPSLFFYLKLTEIWSLLSPSQHSITVKVWHITVNFLVSYNVQSNYGSTTYTCMNIDCILVYIYKPSDEVLNVFSLHSRKLGIESLARQRQLWTVSIHAVIPVHLKEYREGM